MHNANEISSKVKFQQKEERGVFYGNFSVLHIGEKASPHTKYSYAREQEEVLRKKIIKTLDKPVVFEV